MESTTRLALALVAATLLVTLVAGTAAACHDPFCNGDDCSCGHSTGLLDGALHDAVHEFHGVVLGALAAGIGVALTVGHRAVR